MGSMTIRLLELRPIITTYDAIVIGAGQAGGPLASAFAAAGRRTVLVEREHAGGTCINEGCTPTKTMIASARVAYLARRAADFGVETGEIRVNQTKIRDRKRAIVESFRSGSESRIVQTKGLVYLRGEASFSGPNRLKVALSTGDQEISSDLIVIDAGARPAAVAMPGLDSVRHFNSTTIMELSETPDHLLIVGGGAIGVEFAQMFRRFGSRVTLLHHGSKLLGHEDGDVADAVARILEDDGIAIHFNASAESVRTHADSLVLTVAQDGRQQKMTGSHLLLATGRTPNTDRLDPGNAGINLDERGYIPVNERLETNRPGIYAVGDINGGPAFTHISYDDYRILKANLIDNGDRTTTNRDIPYCVFIDPELGRIGMSERQAREKGFDVRIAKMPMTSVARALESDETRGFMKAVVDRPTGKILGAAVLSVAGGELMTMIQIAMMGNLPFTTLRDATIAHPTLAESLNNLFSALDQ